MHAMHTHSTPPSNRIYLFVRSFIECLIAYAQIANVNCSSQANGKWLCWNLPESVSRSQCNRLRFCDHRNRSKLCGDGRTGRVCVRESDDSNWIFDVKMVFTKCVNETNRRISCVHWKFQFSIYWFIFLHSGFVTISLRPTPMRYMIYLFRSSKRKKMKTKQMNACLFWAHGTRASTYLECPHCSAMHTHENRKEKRISHLIQFKICLPTNMRDS